MNILTYAMLASYTNSLLGIITGKSNQILSTLYIADMFRKRYNSTQLNNVLKRECLLIKPPKGQVGHTSWMVCETLRFQDFVNKTISEGHYANRAHSINIVRFFYLKHTCD